MDAHTFFAEQGPISRPGAPRVCFADLPASLGELVEAVRNLTIHVFWAERYGLQVSPDRLAELQLRTIERRLAATLALDGRPLIEPRQPERKLLGNCRDHSVLLAVVFAPSPYSGPRPLRLRRILRSGPFRRPLGGGVVERSGGAMGASRRPARRHAVRSAADRL